MHAVAAHEFAELQSYGETNGARHIDAIMRTMADTRLPQASRDIIQDQAIRVARGEDPQVHKPEDVKLMRFFLDTSGIDWLP